ncbi:MAG: hypothetical protein E6772_17465 [Dysgonomonas sp.]|nr:hypothetical protein [Dysgonomonas sp.]
MEEKNKKDLQEKRRVLDNAIKQLKQEFIGIDSVIDQITTAITSWYFFPEMQERPVIINLWGLTGIGKTSLVKRLVQLIDFDKQYYRFDLGESSGEYFDIQDSFRDIQQNSDGTPFIIGLDEFQLARTINEDQEEVDRATIRSIWDLLDSGKFDVISFGYYVGSLSKLIKRLNLAIIQGIQVKNGIVTSDQELFKELVYSHYDPKEEKDEDEVIFFVPDSDLNNVYEVANQLFLNKMAVRKKLNELDGEETLDFLAGLYKEALKPRTVDCTKSLIFVMGNLDEVYTMSRNFNPDMSADEFHRQSREITITEVKNSLLNRFRSEQIARLGNNHIIYPSFNQESFYKIIRLELDKVKKKIMDIYNLTIEFGEDIEKLVYAEGVYPTQGTRPLFTTVYQIINTRLGKILEEIYFGGVDVDNVQFSIGKQPAEKDCTTIQINFIKDEKVVHYITDNQLLVLGKLRQEKQNDEQAIIAVHESGHAILSSILMKTIPESVFSVTADSASSGFVLTRPEWNYISRKEIINRLAVLLGGWVAEKIIFGEENVTIGSSSDLSNATKLAINAVYSCGMGSTRVAFGNENTNSTPPFIFDKNEESVNNEAKEWLMKAENLAEDTLLKQKRLLIKMADYLSDKRTMDKEMIKEFVGQYSTDFDMSEIVEDADHLYYRRHLKDLASDIE